MDDFEKACADIAREKHFSFYEVHNAASHLRGKMADSDVLEAIRRLCDAVRQCNIATHGNLTPDQVTLALMNLKTPGCSPS